ncbi:MAG: (d)CMP kinase [Gammaproteobacteria bacterium]|nr:(d)CMP kinase [Gammaproteobacteria bacterium]
MTTACARVVTLDGPVGSGKGAVGQIVAQRLSWHYLDSGALYRVLAYVAMTNSVPPDDVNAMVELARTLKVEWRPRPGDVPEVLLSNTNVSELIRSEACGDIASQLAAAPPIRKSLLMLQRRAYRPPGLVADGRDMGTVVFPDAVLKIFLTASAEVRAERRYKQLKEKGFDVSLPPLLQGILERDERDSTRTVSPMAPAEDASVIDTSNMTIEDTVARILQELEQKFADRSIGYRSYESA